MKMRKVLSALLVAACTLSLAACGSSSSKNETTGASGETAAGSANTAKVIDVDLTSEEYAFGVDKTQPELLEQTNTFIQKIKDDGTLDAICAKYFGDGEPEAVESALQGENLEVLWNSRLASGHPLLLKADSLSHHHPYKVLRKRCGKYFPGQIIKR